MKKRFLALTLALAMTSALLAGCAGAASAGSASGSSSAAPTEPAAEQTATQKIIAEDEGKTLEELTLDEFKQYSDLFEDDVYTAIDLTTCCEGRTSYGGPTKASVMKQVADVKGKLA